MSTDQQQKRKGIVNDLLITFETSVNLNDELYIILTALEKITIKIDKTNMAG